MTLEALLSLFTAQPSSVYQEEQLLFILVFESLCSSSCFYSLWHMAHILTWHMEVASCCRASRAVTSPWCYHAAIDSLDLRKTMATKESIRANQNLQAARTNIKKVHGMHGVSRPLSRKSFSINSNNAMKTTTTKQEQNRRLHNREVPPWPLYV